MKRKIFEYLTIFPDIIPGYLHASILGRAEKKKLLSFHSHDLRTWTHDRHRTVDDKPFGGGPGMVMKVAPFHEALISLGLRKKNGKKSLKAKKARVILTSASGKPFTHKDAVRLSKYDRIVYLCGRYEGVDHRVEELLADESFRIGEYVLTGGELPALVMTDAIARHIPGVLGESESLAEESWTEGTGEYPQYTRPENYLGMNVPEILMSGDHKKIEAWRKAHRQ